MGDVRDDVPLNAVRAALEAVDSGRVQIARDNLRILEIHLRAQHAARGAVPEVRIPIPGDLIENASRHACRLQGVNPDAGVMHGSDERQWQRLSGTVHAAFHYYATTIRNARPVDAAPQPAGEVVLRHDLVPGVMRCAKCAFQLHRVTLYVRSGTTGAGDSDTEPCPNGCGPLWPVTWRQWAEEAQEYAKRLRDELDALKAEPALSVPSPGDALSLDGAAGRSASRAPADAEAVAGWLFYFSDDEGTPHAMHAPDRVALYAEVAEWMTGERTGPCPSDLGDDIIEGVVSELIAEGAFYPEGDPPCFARRLTGAQQAAKDGAE